jgi:phosphatidylglycerophosphate synthase
MVLVARPRLAGVFALAAGALLVVSAAVARRERLVVEHLVDSFTDRAFDGCVLAAIAWASRRPDPATSVAAVVALGGSFLAAYVRARGASLGYDVEESVVTRGLRYGLVCVGLLAGWLDWTLWVLATLMLLAAGVRASQVAKEERA